MRLLRGLLPVLVLALFLVPHSPAHAATTSFFGPIIPQVCYCDKVANPGGGTIATAPDWGCVLQTVQNIMNLMVSLSVLVATLVIAYAGGLFVMSPTNPGNREQGRTVLLNAVIGIVIVLASWLIIDTMMKFFYNPSAGNFGPWNSILASNGSDYCIKVIAPTSLAQNGTNLTIAGGPSGSTGASGSQTVGSAGQCSASAASKAKAAEQYQSQVCAAATADNISGQCDQLLGILGQESHGNASITSSAGAVGLMQLEPSTAAPYVPACKGSSDSNPSAACVAALKDPTTNINAGVAYYAKLYQQNNGDVTLATAAYNGGQGANGASKDCATGTKWQCTVNGAGYQQTRDYVGYVDSIALEAGGQCGG